MIKMKVKRCFSQFCNVLNLKWGGSIWNFDDAKRGYGPKQGTFRINSDGSIDYNTYLPMRFF